MGVVDSRKRVWDEIGEIWIGSLFFFGSAVRLFWFLFRLMDFE